MSLPKMEDQTAIKEAASQGIKSMEQLIRLLSSQQPQQPSSLTDATVTRVSDALRFYTALTLRIRHFNQTVTITENSGLHGDLLQFPLHSDAIQRGNSIVASSVLTPGEVVLGFLIMVLLALSQMQSSKNSSPLVSDPIKMYIFIVSLFLCGISLYVVKKTQTTNSHEYLPLCEDIYFFLGCVLCDLLLFILPPLGYMAAFFCLCLFVRIIYLHHTLLILLRNVLAQGYHWLRRVPISIYSHASGSHSAGSDAAAADGVSIV